MKTKFLPLLSLCIISQVVALPTAASDVLILRSRPESADPITDGVQIAEGWKRSEEVTDGTQIAEGWKRGEEVTDGTQIAEGWKRGDEVTDGTQIA
ncbi:hypothetical protein EAF04_008276 [Stromatinia cepivora]|nr:hypothetical protein EAF04_008276 [Stromatinia cepivora]